MFKQKAKTSFSLPPILRALGWLKLVFFLVALSGVFLYTRAGTPTRVEAATSSTLNFQARLYNASGTIVPDGTYNIEFKLHNHLTNTGGGQGACSGSCEWRETRTGGNRVTVKNGYFSANLGSVTGFPTNINWDEDLWLSMNIGGTSVTPSWDGEMSPRIKLTAVPYAFRAGGITSFNGTQSGNLSFGTVANSPNILLPDIAGTNGVLLQNGTTLMTQGSITFVDAQGRLTQDNANFFWNDTQNRLGIGTASPSEALEVAGTVRSDALHVDTAGTAGTPSIRLGTGLGIFSPGANTFAIATNSLERLTIESDGDVDVDSGTLFVSATTNSVGVGDSTPAYPFTVGNGDLFGVQADGSLIFEGSSADAFETVLEVVNPTADLTFQLPNVTTGTYEICTSANNCTALGAYINNTTTVQTDANIAIQSAGTASITQLIRARSGQTADLLQFQDSSSNTLSGINENGQLYYVDPTGGETVTFALQDGSISTDRTILLPNVGGTICTTAGNCLGNGGSGDVFQGGQDGPLVIGTNNNTSFYLETNNTNRVEITGTGLVGIGTSTTPSQLLSVGGTAGNFTVDASGNIVTAGNLTVNGSSIQLGNNPADVLTVFAAATFNTDVDFSLAENENVSITSTQTNSSNLNLFDLSFTNNSTGGTQTGARIQNAGGTADTEQLLLIDNADIDNAVTTGLLIQSAAGGITTGIDLSDTEIGTGINLGANDIIGTTAVINFDNFDVSAGGDVTLAGDLDAGLLVVDNTAGTATSTGGLIFSGVAGNDITTGTDEDLTLQANGAGEIVLNDLVQIGALGTGGDTALCLNSSGQISNCDSGVFGVTLQDAYDASSTPEIVLDATRGALTLRDNATPLGANLLEVQSNDGSTTYFAVTATGLLTSGDVSLTGATGTIATTTTDAPLTIQSNGAGALTLDSTGAGAINIGTSANAKTITVGNGTGATQLVLDAGTGGINIGTNGVANTIQIGNTSGAVVQNINIGTNPTLLSQTNVTIGSTVDGTVSLQGPTTITNRATGTADTLVVNNSSSTGTIAVFQDNGVAVLTINDGGSITGTGTYTFSGVATDITTGTDEDLTVEANGAGEIVLNDLVQIGALGAADTDAVLCQNTLGQIASCSSTFATTDNAFLQNGNDFGVGVDGTLGLTSANDLHLITDNTTRITVEADGDVAVDTDTLFVSAADNAVGIGTSSLGAGSTLTVEGTGLFRVGGTGGSVSIAAPGGASGISISNTNRSDIRYDDNALYLLAGTGAAAPQATSGITILNGGSVGIGTTGPDRRLDVLDASNPQIRLTHTDGSVFTDLQTDGSGNFLVDVTGTKVDLADDLEVSGNDILDGSGTTRITLGSTNVLTGDLTIQGDITRTIAADSGTTNTIANVDLTTPIDTTGTNVHQGISLTPVIGNSTGGTNTVNVINIADTTGDDQVSLNALRIGNLTGTAANEYALNIGSGWDSVLRVNGVEVINGSGEIVSDTIAGDLFDTAADSGTGSILQGETFTINGGTNGVDTVLTGDTITVDLDYTEITTATFGTGSGFTWTYDVGAVDPSFTFADDALTVTAGATTLSGDLAVNGGNITSSGALAITPNAGDDLSVNLSTTGDFIVNTSQLFVDTSESRVGIGTATPAASLHVLTDGGAEDTLLINSGASTGNIFVAQDNGVTVFSIADGGNITASGNITFDGAVTDITTGTDQDLTIQANGLGEIVLDDTVQVSTLGSADNTAFICRNSSGQLAACNTTGIGAAFVQGGNSFGDTAVLGTNDAENLELETAGVTRLTIDQSGNATLTGNLGVQGGSITTNQTTFNLLDDTATTVNAFGDATTINIGAATGTTNINNSLDVVGTINAGTGNAFQVSSAGAVTAVGVNSGTGLLQGTGGMTLTGATSINTTGTASTSIGNATGSVTLNGAAILLNSALLSRQAAGTTSLLLTDAANTTFAINNLFAGTASLTVEGSGTFGTGLTVTTGGANITGVVTLNTVGAADNATLVCRNSSGQLAACNTTGAGAVFVQGGNSFGATGILGTNDANDLQLETAGTTRLTIDQSGNATLTGNLTIQGTGTSSFAGNLEIDGNTTIGDANTDTLTITGTAVTIPNGLNFDSNTLFIDDDTDRVGIGTATPDVALQVSSGTEATLTNGSGHLVLGSVSGANLVSDSDEIQARNNGAASTLFLQPAGGNIAVGQSTADGRLHIQGAADDEQLVITANSTQTANIIEVRSSGGTVLAAVTGDGILKIDTVAAPTLSQAKLLVTNAEVVDRLRVGDATDRIETDATTQQLRFYGTARNSKAILLSPEFAGATMSGSGVGTMTSDFCSNSSPAVNTGVCAAANERHNYYNWTANATNAYSVFVKWRVPSDFSELDGATPIQFYGTRSSSSAGTSVTLTLIDSATGATCGSATPITNTTAWTITTYTHSGCTLTRNQEMIWRIDLSVGVNGEAARIGEIYFNYKADF